jgi:hypothetical protein
MSSSNSAEKKNKNMSRTIRTIEPIAPKLQYAQINGRPAADKGW